MSNSMIRTIATVNGNCPGGGDHQRGTSGEWIGHCIKCGHPC